jgi:hypothetical protein
LVNNYAGNDNASVQQKLDALAQRFPLYVRRFVVNSRIALVHAYADENLL